MTINTSQATFGDGAASHKIEHKGVLFEFGRLTRGKMEEYGARMIRRDRERLRSVYGNDDSLLQQALAGLERRVLAGEYEFLEPLTVGAPKVIPQNRVIDGREVKGVQIVPEGGEVNTPRGKALLISVLSGRDESESLALLLGKRVEVESMLSLVMKESLGDNGDGWTALPEGTPEGNVQAPARPPAHP